MHIALMELAARASAPIEVSSPAFKAGDAIPAHYSNYGDNVSPPLSWSLGPPGTAAYALIVEDPDAPGPDPFVHWLAYNIPPTVQSLKADISPRDGGAMLQGKNSTGSTGWFGPRPPQGPAHHYHFEVFALDAALDPAAGIRKTRLVGAMQGHVLAKGELVATYKAR